MVFVEVIVGCRRAFEEIREQSHTNYYAENVKSV